MGSVRRLGSRQQEKQGQVGTSSSLLPLLPRQKNQGTEGGPAHLKASPMAWAPVAQAVATAWLGPRKPWAMLTAPAAMLTRVLGTKKGLSRRSLPSA